MSKLNFLKSATLAVAGLAVITSISSCSAKKEAHNCAAKKEEKAACKAEKHTCKGSKCSSAKKEAAKPATDAKKTSK
jgi:hypothetical protein